MKNAILWLFAITIVTAAIAQTDQLTNLSNKSYSPSDKMSQHEWLMQQDLIAHANQHLQEHAAPARGSYCEGGPSSTFGANVEWVFLEGENGTEINHTTGCPGVSGVEDLTHLLVDLYRGETYTLSVTFGTCNGTLYENAGSVWIDWSRTFEFGAGDLLHESTGYPGEAPWDGPVTITFTVPTGAATGNNSANPSRS